MAHIPPAILDILLRSDATSKANAITLPARMDRSLYVAVAAEIKALGGKWNRSEKAHLFPDGMTKFLSAIADPEGKYVHDQKELGFFPTPPEVSRAMVRVLDLKDDLLILEPSAGDGALISEVDSAADARRIHGLWFDAIEVDPGRAAGLQIQRAVNRLPYTVLCLDFLTVDQDPIYDRVIMNPPFSKDQDAAHIRHAWGFLKPGGKLVAVAGAGLATRFHGAGRWVHETVLDLPYSSITPLPAGSFKASGTDVSTVLVVMTKPLRPSAIRPQ
jgi:hypothetical protein